jgi:hypothetical protein
MPELRYQYQYSPGHSAKLELLCNAENEKGARKGKKIYQTATQSQGLVWVWDIEYRF